MTALVSRAAARLRADLAAAVPGKGCDLVGSHATAVAASASLAARLSSMVDPRQAPFGAVLDGVADDTAAIQAALNTGRPVLLSGPALVSSTLTNAGSLMLCGVAGAEFADCGNSPVSRAAGPSIKWAGPSGVPVIQFNPDTGQASRCSIRNLAIIVPDSYASSAVRVVGARWFGFTGPTPSIRIRDVSVYRDSGATTPGSSSATGVEFVCNEAGTARHVFGAAVSDCFFYGLNQCVAVTLVNGPAGGNWFNGNSIRGLTAYKCYRLFNFVGGTNGDTQISANEVGPAQIQPVGDNGGVLADGVVRLVGNVNRNTFRGVTVFDLVSGRRFKHVNPWTVDNSDTWNVVTGCSDFECDADSQMVRWIDGRRLSWSPSVLVGGSSIGVTLSPEVGRLVRHGDLVTVDCDITITATGAGAAGAAVELSLPVQHADSAAVAVSLLVSNAAGAIFGFAADIPSLSNAVVLRKYAASGSSLLALLTKADIQVGTTIRFSATYRARV